MKSIKYGLFLSCIILLFLSTIPVSNSAVRSVGSDTGSATATETKSCWQQGYRMISCPDGNCQTCTDSSNGKNYFRKGTCNTTGYINSCPAGSGQIPDPLTKLSCNSEYSLTCVCDTSVYKYGEGRTPCEQSSLGGGTCTIGGKTFYKTCECPAQYSKTCEIGVELPVDANDSCGGKYQACKCITQVVAVGQTCTQKVVNGTTCYVDCRAETIKTCETEGYVTSCPVGQVGTSVTANDGKLSCYAGCSNKKYMLMAEMETLPGVGGVYKIKALKDFGDVKRGDIGGWVESEANLSQEGLSWVAENAIVYGSSYVEEDALVSGSAVVSNNSWIHGSAVVAGFAQVDGDADWVEIFDEAYIYGNAKVHGRATVHGEARVSGYAELDGGNVYGAAWVEGNALVSTGDPDLSIYGNAHIYGDAQIRDYAQVYGDVEVYDDAHIFGEAEVSGYMDASNSNRLTEISGNAKIYGNAKISDRVIVKGNSKVYGDAQVFGDVTISGIISQDIKLNTEIYGNAKISGKAEIEGTPKISGNVKISDYAHVYDNAQVSGNVVIENYSKVYGNAVVSGDTENKTEIILDAQVSGFATVENSKISDYAHVYGNALVKDNSYIYSDAQVYGNALVFKSNIGGEAKLCGNVYVDNLALIENGLFFCKGYIHGGRYTSSIYYDEYNLCIKDYYNDCGFSY